MNELAPPLSVTFAGMTAPLTPDCRALCYALIHISEHPAALASAYAFIQQQLKAVTPPADGADSYHPDKLAEAFSSATVGINHPLAQDYAHALTPVRLTELAWLDNIVQACNNQSPLALALLALSQQLQAAMPSCESTNVTALPALHTWAFAQQSDIPDVAYQLAALQLALGQFPRDFFAEILGFTYAYCQIGVLPAQQAALSTLLPLMRHYLTEIPAAAQDIPWQRIQSGYWLYRQAFEHCMQQIQAHIAHPLSTQQAFIALLERLRTAAIGHHGAIMLNGRALDVWFAQTPFDGEGFLQALRQSHYIDHQHPANSRLLKLFKFSGSMFGVLNASELALLTRWVSTEEAITPPAPRGTGTPLAVYPNWRMDTVRYATPRSQRDWYYTLVNIDQFPTALSAAKQRVYHLLRLTRWFSHLPFTTYSHLALNNFITGIYQQAVSQYQPLTTAPKISKQTYIWGIEQLAPAILIDGCWLQNIQQLKYHPTHAIGALLSPIYTDELGGCLLTQNHPYLYQQLLNSVKLQLPPIDSRAFSEHTGFMNSAFDIPNYLLAISKFPSAFLPELLGLNLAIELSGLGKDYLRLAQALKFHGLDPTIVNVHIAIDNVATGHTALAQQAIQQYMDDILAYGGVAAMQLHWRRIYTGYCSLAWVSRRFTLALIGNGLLRYGAKFLPSNAH